MEEIVLIINDISCTDICRLSTSKVVGVDSSISYMYCPVTENISIPENTVGDNTRLCHVANSDGGCSDTSLLGDISNSFRLESGYSGEEAAE